jgi:hypothetical protein
LREIRELCTSTRPPLDRITGGKVLLRKLKKFLEFVNICSS